MNVTAEKERCSYCLGYFDKLHVDHIEPKSKGGNNSLDNLTPACQSCNFRKRMKSLIEFLQEMVADDLQPGRPNRAAEAKAKALIEQQAAVLREAMFQNDALLRSSLRSFELIREVFRLAGFGEIPPVSGIGARALEEVA